MKTAKSRAKRKIQRISQAHTPKDNITDDPSWLLNREQEFLRMIAEIGSTKDSACREAIDCKSDFAFLRKLFRGASPEMARVAGAAFRVGSAWGVLSRRQWEHRTKGAPEPDDYELFRQIQLAAEKFLAERKNRDLKPRFQDLADNWDRSYGFPITRQKFTLWRKSGIGFVCAGPRFRLTNPASEFMGSDVAKS
jgi:hypothetical protein